MNPKNLSSYVGVINQLPSKWNCMKKWLLHINYAPVYAPEPEQRPACRQFSRREGCVPFPIPPTASFAEAVRRTA